MSLTIRRPCLSGNEGCGANDGGLFGAWKIKVGKAIKQHGAF